jgi:hypothetical protein
LIEGAPFITYCAELPENAGPLWILEFHNKTENILTHEAINVGFKPALDLVEREWRTAWRRSRRRTQKSESDEELTGDGSGALIITGHGRYFCGGKVGF